MFTFIMHHKVVVVIVGVLVAGFAWYGLTQSAPSDSLISTEVISNDGPDQDLVATLLALRAVKLDGSIFSNPAFISLKDFSTEIIPEPIGRPNPFAPLGATVVPTQSTTQGAQIFTPATTR